MTPHEIVSELKDVLSAERVAIRRLDGAAVEQAADQKLRCMNALAENDLTGRAEWVPILRDLLAELRRNGVLLAHARDTLRDTLITFRRGNLAPTARGAPETFVIAPRLSLRG